MGVHQVSVDLYPPNREQRVVLDGNAELLDSVEVPGAVVDKNLVCSFLENRNYAFYTSLNSGYCYVYSDVIESPVFGSSYEREVKVYFEKEYLESILFQFYIPGANKSNVNEWADCLHDISERFQLKIVDSNGKMWSKDKSIGAITNNINWISFTTGKWPWDE